MKKTERKAAIRALIDKYKFNWPFNERDTAQINKLTGWSFKGYQRVKNPKWTTDMRCLAHTSDGQKWEIWSWNKAVDNYGSFGDMLEAMRLAVQYQIRKFAASAQEQCAVCGSTECLAIDHKDVPFIVLVRDFIKANPNMNEAIENDASGAGWYIKDLDVKDTWVRFHKVNATYQVLCRSCNSKKGAKHGNERLETRVSASEEAR
jgi:hypothetical protein